MPIEWDIDEDRGLATIRARGTLTPEGARQTLAALYAQPSYRPPMVDLWDLREARIEARPGDVLSLVNFIRANRGDRGTERTALLVSSNLAYGVSRMYQTYIEAWLPLSIGVFRQLDEAQAWLEQGSSRDT